jgi:hypothetical protein
MRRGHSRTVAERLAGIVKTRTGPGSRAAIESLEPRRRMSSISGTVYNDVNGNGTPDAREPGLAGMVIYRDANNNGVLDASEQRVTSDAAGNYVFNYGRSFGLPPAPYREVVPAGWRLTQGPYLIGISGNANITGKNFGNQYVGTPAGAATAPSITAAASTTDLLSARVVTGPEDQPTDNVASDAAQHTVTVPLRGSAAGNLTKNLIVGHASVLGRFTASFNAQGLLVITTANGDQLRAAAGPLVPTGDSHVFQVSGTYVGATGRFAGATGTFSHDITFINDQGDFLYQIDTMLTLQLPGKGNQ